MGWSATSRSRWSGCRRRRRPRAALAEPRSSADRAVRATQDSPAAVARLLAEAGFGASRLTVLSDLGADTETRDGHARPRAGPAPRPPLNLVACGVPSGEGWSLAPGLPDQAYDHDGQLTKRDVRASALAHLAPRPGQLLWDVGAGAGSIAIEWLRSDPSCRAIAVERNPERAKRIEANAARLGVPGLSVVGTARRRRPSTGLPRPDAIFVGGGADGGPDGSRLGSRCDVGGSAGRARRHPRDRDDHQRRLAQPRRRADPDLDRAPRADRPLPRWKPARRGRAVERRAKL